MANKKKTVAALGGDGIGPEVVDAACYILEKAGFGLNIVKPLNGQLAVNQGKEFFSDETRKICDASDAVIFGAADKISNPILFYLRWTYNNYLLVRPIKYYPGARSCAPNPAGIDFVMFRELSEDLYPGQEGDLSLLVGASDGPSVPTMLRQSPAGSLPLRAEVETSHGYAPYH